MPTPILLLEGAATIIDEATWEAEVISAEGADPAYGGVEYQVPSGLTPANLSSLEFEYLVSEGGVGGGSPRLSLVVAGENVIHVAIGSPPNFDDPADSVWHTLANLTDPTVTEGRFDLSQFGGPFLGNWSDVLAMMPDALLTAVAYVADGWWKTPPRQVARVRNLTIVGGVPTVYRTHNVIDCSTGDVSFVDEDVTDELARIAAEQDAARIAALQQEWTNLRFNRDNQLARTDFLANYLLSGIDSGFEQDFKDELEANRQPWLDWRQALRDLPENTTDPYNVAWPVPPAHPALEFPALV